MKKEDSSAVNRQEIEEILGQCKVCRLAMIADGQPYVIPLNFGYAWDDDGLTLYFHSGLRGKKMDALWANPRVCFELDWEAGLTGEGEMACRYSYAFRSIVGMGSVQFAENNAEKRYGFDRIMRHQTGRDGWTYTDRQLSVASVFSVRAEELSTRSKLPQKG